MAHNIPKTTKQWSVTGTSGFDDLKFSETPVPQVGDNQCLVRIEAASLNVGSSIGTPGVERKP
jgi:NADPH:quinone reductase-like Zn-dependent oxidoreductase